MTLTELVLEYSKILPNLEIRVNCEEGEYGRRFIVGVYCYQESGGIKSRRSFEIIQTEGLLLNGRYPDAVVGQIEMNLKDLKFSEQGAQ